MQETIRYLAFCKHHKHTKKKKEKQMSESQGIYISIYSSGFPCSLGPKKSDRGSKRKGKT
jgi:hypothetical protein